MGHSVDTEARAARATTARGRPGKKVVIVTGASQGIGAGIAAAFSASGYAVVGTARSIEPSDTPDVLTVAGDITKEETAELVVQRALDRFGRIDTLVNNAGIFIGRPFIEYTVDEYLAHHVRQPHRLLPHHPASHQADGGSGRRPRGQRQHEPRRPPRQQDTVSPLLADQRRAGGCEPLLGHRVRKAGRPGQHGRARHHQDPVHDEASYQGLADRHPLGRLGDVSDVVDGILYLERATFVTGETLHIDGGRAAGG